MLLEGALSATAACKQTMKWRVEACAAAKQRQGGREGARRPRRAARDRARGRALRPRLLAVSPSKRHRRLERAAFSAVARAHRRRAAAAVAARRRRLLVARAAPRVESQNARLSGAEAERNKSAGRPRERVAAARGVDAGRSHASPRKAARRRRGPAAAARRRPSTC